MSTPRRIDPVEVDAYSLSSMLLCAFRYSLGRMTYITGDCADWLNRYWEIMPIAWKKQIHDDIRGAIERSQAGHQCDVSNWECVLALPIEEDVE